VRTRRESKDDFIEKDSAVLGDGGEVNDGSAGAVVVSFFYREAQGQALVKQKQGGTSLKK
jgi:hypothetical protein